MNCKQIQKRMVAWLFRELNDTSLDNLIENHLKVCTDCAEEEHNIRMFNVAIHTANTKK